MKNPIQLTHLYLTLSALLALSVSNCATSSGKQETALGNNSLGRDLKGNVSEVVSRSQDALKELGIPVTDTSSKGSGKERDLSGSAGGHEVSVRVNDIGNGMSHVEVTAKDGQFQWNQDYAKKVLDKIISKS